MQVALDTTFVRIDGHCSSNTLSGIIGSIFSESVFLNLHPAFLELFFLTEEVIYTTDASRKSIALFLLRQSWEVNYFLK